MNRCPPSIRHNRLVLGIERLEERNPASTTLDVLLTGLWMSSGNHTDRPVVRQPEFENHAANGADRIQSPRIEELTANRPALSHPAISTALPINTPQPTHSHGSNSLKLDDLDPNPPLPSWFRNVFVGDGTAPPAGRGGGFSVPVSAEQPTPVTNAPAVALSNTATVNPSEIRVAAVQPVTAANAPAGGITITPATQFIPVNANKTNGGPWQKDAAGTVLTGLPLIRDFNLAPMKDLSTWDGQYPMPQLPNIADPELKQVAVTVANPMPGATIQMEVTFTSGLSGGRLRFWQDQDKVNQISLIDDGPNQYSGTLPGFPTSTFYVEGIQPSLQANDITIQVTSASQPPAPGQPPQMVTAQTTLTVTPIVAEFSVNTNTPPNCTFARDQFMKIYGIFSGDGTNPGVKYTADVTRTGISGDSMLLQNVRGLDHANPTVNLTNGKQYNPSFGTATFPMVDSVAGGPPIPYYTTPYGVNNADRQTILTFDNPALGSEPLFAGLLNSMDATFRARMYLVWRYPDATIYTLAYADWQAVFQAATNAQGVLALSNTSIVSVSPKILTSVDPEKVVGPTYNSFIQGAGFWV